MNTDDQFFIFLKAHYPYLYDIEMKVRKVIDQTGFGEVSATLLITRNKVVGSQVGEFLKTQYEV